MLPGCAILSAGPCLEDGTLAGRPRGAFVCGGTQAAARTVVDPENPARGFVSIRVGMHCGPATGTVIGSLRPKYTLLGDTVRVRLM